MKECTERRIKIGLTKKPEKIFDDIEKVTASMHREGWQFTDYIIEEGWKYIHLFFERDINFEGICLR